MELALNFYNAIVFLSSLLPIWALIIDRIKLKGKKWFWLSETVFIGLALFCLIFFQHYRWFLWARFVWFLYAMEMAIMLFLFTKRFGYSNFSRNLASSLLIVYVLTEAHEWIRFVLCDYLHFFVDPYTIMVGRVPTYQRILSNLYVIISFGFACKFANLKADRKTMLLFSLTLLIPVLFVNIESLHYLHVFKRALMFGLWASIFYHFSGEAK